MVGKSNGTYSQSRKFEPKGYVTVGDANNIANRVKSKSKRIKLSYDGQVIRTTNLPKNYKKYPYILASFPNSFYEIKFDYERVESKDPLVEYEDYCTPKNMDKMVCGGDFVGKEMKEDGEDIIANLRKNLETRLNFNYKTTKTNQWISDLASTYKYYPEDVAKDLKDYVNKAKKRKVVVQSKNIVIEPSAAYWCRSSIVFRVHAKIKVTASKWAEYKSHLQKEMIFAVRDTGVSGMKNGKWCDITFDVYVAGAYGDTVRDYKLDDTFDIFCRAGE